MWDFDNFIPFVRKQTGVPDTEIPDADPIFSMVWRLANSQINNPQYAYILGEDWMGMAVYNLGTHYFVLYGTALEGSVLYGIKQNCNVLQGEIFGVGNVSSSSNGASSTSIDIPDWAKNSGVGLLARTMWGQEYMRIIQPLRRLSYVSKARW